MWGNPKIIIQCHHEVNLWCLCVVSEGWIGCCYKDPKDVYFALKLVVQCGPVYYGSYRGSDWHDLYILVKEELVALRF